MIRCHLAKLMGERKLKLADVIRDTGISRHTVRALYKEENVQIDQEDLGRLCRYFNCKVGDLFELSD